MKEHEEHDLFICHAGEDKEDFVRPLAQELRDKRLKVWYDEFQLTVGDSLREAIDKGLASSQYGIVVLSPHFFTKRWPQRELNGLVARENAEGSKLILPIWHNIEHDEVAQHSPLLADLYPIRSSCGLEKVVNELLRKLRPDENPLNVARDYLIEKGYPPTVFTDEWWLIIKECQVAQLQYPDLNLGRRWIFPLPYPDAKDSKEVGLNLANTALQMDWSDDGEDRKICQLTRPEQVYEYLREWPDLLECARENPGVLAMYAPQLTIGDFDTDLSDVFDALLEPDRSDAYQSPGYGSGPETTDGNAPLCGELIAWRHPTYGNYADTELACSFVNAHNEHYSRKMFSAFECLAWLLSEESNWLPSRLHETLLSGMRNKTYWWTTDVFRSSNHFSKCLRTRSKSRFNLTRNIKSDIEKMFAAALGTLEIQEEPATIAKRFIDGDFIDGYYEEERRIREARRKH